MSGVRGRSGRKALPRATKELTGTFRKDQHNETEPILDALVAAPRCPSHLKGEAQKTWREMAKLLTAMGVLTAVDLHALEALCVVYARWVEAEVKLEEYGTMLSNAGRIYPSPYLRIADNSAKEMRAWMNEFGVTPSSRSRVRVDKKPEKKDQENWFGITNDSRN